MQLLELELVIKLIVLHSAVKMKKHDDPQFNERYSGRVSWYDPFHVGFSAITFCMFIATICKLFCILHVSWSYTGQCLELHLILVPNYRPRLNGGNFKKMWRRDVFFKIQQGFIALRFQITLLSKEFSTKETYSTLPNRKISVLIPFWKTAKKL